MRRTRGYNEACVLARDNAAAAARCFAETMPFLTGSSALELLSARLQLKTEHERKREKESHEKNDALTSA
ncbi:hypothetical protein JOB18_036477 [Solea senegalensis]|uniref:Uncharacterized protein n=1 Tax=Solea senegalensis TaxID=28829 RepID=A0AAV6S4L8_SOLSE|nr:hypothetical protein JOB18_036477 [Solea senegalensis]